MDAVTGTSFLETDGVVSSHRDARVLTVLSCRITRQLVVPPEEPDAEHAGEEKTTDK